MKSCLQLLLAAGISAILAASAGAMPPGEATPKGPSAYPMDCAKAKDQARCASLNKDIEACRDKTGDAWRECMHQPPSSAKFTPPKPRDCSKASNKERCQAHTVALEACKDRTTRAEHRKCMADRPPSATN